MESVKASDLNSLERLKQILNLITLLQTQASQALKTDKCSRSIPENLR